MAQGRLSVTAHKRSSGQSVAAAIAYRAGVALLDARTGELHDYGWRGARQQVVTSALVGVGADHFGSDLQAFAAAVEKAETRSNSRIGRDIVANVPTELPQEEQIALLTRMGTAISERYNTPCSVSFHRADPRGDDRNDHGHIWMGTRAIRPDGTFGPKIRVLDDVKTGPKELTALRNLYEGLTNRALERAGVEQRIDISKRDDDAVDGPLPQPRLGRAATADERRAAIAAGINIKGMSAAELVCAHEPVTQAGRDLREYVLSERAIEQQIEKSRAETGGLYRAYILDRPASIEPTPIPARTRRDFTAVPAARALDGIPPTPIRSTPQPVGAAPVRALGPAAGTRPTPIRSTPQPVGAAPVRALGPAAGTKPTPIRSTPQPVGAAPVRALGPAAGTRPTPIRSTPQPVGAAPVRALGPAAGTRPTPIRSTPQPVGAAPVRALGPAAGTRPRLIPWERQPLGAVPVPVVDAAAAIAPKPIESGHHDLAAVRVPVLDPAPAIEPTQIEAIPQPHATSPVQTIAGAVASATQPAPIPAGRAAASASNVAAIGESDPTLEAEPISDSWRLDYVPSRQAMADILVTDDYSKGFGWAQLHDRVADTDPDHELPCSVLACAYHTDEEMRATGERSPTEPRFETDDNEQATVLGWIRAQIQPVLNMIWRQRAADEALEAERNDHKEQRRELVAGGYRESEGPGARPGGRGTYTPKTEIKR